MENYPRKPAEVETHYHGGGTDVILRRNIRQVELQEQGTEPKVFQTWECDEWQFRYAGNLTAEEIQADPGKWWGYTPPKPKEEHNENVFITVGEMRRALTEGVDSL